jgi:uncharacterized membrane protein YedE/YeeE
MGDSSAPAMRALGFATGLGFGALLQRGRLARHEVVLGQLLGDDWRIVKAMATAVGVGGLGVRALVRRGLATPNVKPMKTGGVVGGAVLFGTGLALLGYCPGTCVAAVGEGRRDAVAGVLGMLAGAGLYVALYGRVQRVVDAGANLGKVTVPGYLARRRAARRPGTESAALAGTGAA